MTNIFSSIFAILGLLGAFKEHFWITLIYAIFMVLSSGYSLYMMIQNTDLWPFLVLDSVNCFVSFTYAFALRGDKKRVYA